MQKILHVLIVEPGFKTTREKVFSELKLPDNIVLHACWGLSGYNPTWIRSYTSGDFIFSYKENNLLAKIKEYENLHQIKFSSVITHLDTSVHFVNDVCKDLNLRFTSELPSKTIRNKFSVRENLNKSGLQKGFNYFKANSISNLKELIESNVINYPVIVKPTEMMASLGVFKVNNESELLKYGEIALNCDFHGENLRGEYADMETAVIVEDFIDGPEYSVETLVLNGKPYVLGITKKYTSDGLYWDELGHDFPQSDLSDDIVAKVKSLIVSSHLSLKFSNCFTHTELKIKDSTPYVMEINPRLCGDLIYFLVDKALKIQTGELAIKTSLGLLSEADVLEIQRRTVVPYSVRFFTETESARVVDAISINASECDYELISFMEKNEIIYKPESVYGARLGSLICQTKDVEDLVKNIRFKTQLPILKKKIEESEIAVFVANSNDVDLIFNVEKQVWNEKQSASRELIEKRLALKNYHTLIAYDLKTSNLVGFFTAASINECMLKDLITWDDFIKASLNSKIEECDNFMFGASLSVLDSAPKGTGTFLMEAMRNYASTLKMNRLICGIRIPKYVSYADQYSIDEYVSMLSNAKATEPMYSISKKTGAKLIRVQKNYYEDPDSMNYALIFEHELRS